MSFGHEEFMIENIRRACEKYFAVDKSMSCDILDGEQGLSCNTVQYSWDSFFFPLPFSLTLVDSFRFHFRLEISPLGSNFAECSARGVFNVQSILVYYDSTRLMKNLSLLLFFSLHFSLLLGAVFISLSLKFIFILFLIFNLSLFFSSFYF